MSREEPDWDEKDEDWPDDFPEEEPEEDEEPPQDARGADGKLRVLSERCETCVFRAGNLMSLQPGRLRGMVNTALDSGGYITCHATLTYGEHPDFGPAVCRGFYDAHGHLSNLLRVMDRLGGLDLTITPPSKEPSA